MKIEQLFWCKNAAEGATGGATLLVQQIISAQSGTEDDLLVPFGFY